MTTTTLRGAALLAVLTTLGLPHPAFAQRDGVFVDPDSPAGREYAVPLDQARREAVGGSGSADPRSGARRIAGEGKEPMFGVGVEPEDRSGKAEDGDSGSPGEQGGNQAGGSGPAAGARSTGVVTAVSEGDSSFPLMLGIAALVVAAGAAAGVGLRRLLRGT